MKKTALLLVPVVLGVLLMGCKAEGEGSPSVSESKAATASEVWKGLSGSERARICEATLEGDSSGMLKALEAAGLGEDIARMVPHAIDKCSKSG